MMMAKVVVGSAGSDFYAIEFLYFGFAPKVCSLVQCTLVTSLCGYKLGVDTQYKGRAPSMRRANIPSYREARHLSDEAVQAKGEESVRYHTILDWHPKTRNCFRSATT